VVSIKAALALISQGVWQAVVVLRDAIFHAGLACIRAHGRANQALTLIYLRYLDIAVAEHP